MAMNALVIPAVAFLPAYYCNRWLVGKLFNKFRFC